MYFTAIVLPQDLNERIQAHKNFMFENYGCKVGLKSPAHITLLAPFWMEEMLEAELINSIDLISNQILPFSIATKNFSVFTPKTIFIDVASNINLQQLKEASDNYFKTQPQYKTKIDERPFHPHITIATRDLPKKGFYEAWKVFKQKEFKEAWLAEGLSVLRHNQKNWDVVYTSQFQKL
jgi:2'-5' RNA ligase